MKRYTRKLRPSEEREALAFGKRIEKYRSELVPGMTLKVHEHTGDPAVDNKTILAKVLKVYNNWVLLEDDKGKKYGPTYYNLFSWGNT